MKKKRLLAILTTLIMTTSLATPVLADVLVADGDGMTPVAQSDLNFGDVNSNTNSITKDVLLLLRHNGNSQQNTFMKNTSIKISVDSMHSNLAGKMEDGDIATPLNWGEVANQIIDKDTAKANITLTIPEGTPVGTAQKTIIFTATGIGNDKEPLTITTEMRVIYTVKGITDTTAPIINAINSNPVESLWTNGVVALTVDATDSGSGIAPIDGYSFDGGLTWQSSNVKEVRENKEYVIKVKDVAGNITSRGFSVKNIDVVAPEVSGSADRAANAAGWYNSDVTVSFAANDALSGVANVTQPIVLGEGKDQSVTGTAVDRAGNSAETKVSGINIDKTLPTISGSADRAANETGWYNSDVTVSFTANDALSGVASRTTPVTLGEGKDQSVTGTVTDKAGNSASATITGINIDKTAPTISGSTDRAANAAGWYNDDVTVSFDADDALSGIASSTTPVTLGEGKDQSVIGTAIDNAGNIVSVTVSGINIDKTAPEITAPDNQIFILNSPIKPVWDAIDTLSGIATKSITGFDTSSVGVGTYTITATDNAGNTVTETRTYKVAYQTINVKVPAAAAKGVKAGSTVPISWQFADASGNPVASSNAKPSLSVAYIPGFTSGEQPVDLEAPGASGLRYDSYTQTWQFNWKTEKTTSIGTYYIRITDGNGGPSQTVTVVIGK